MAKFLVQKSDPLYGEVTVSGAKNAVLPLMAASILCDEKCEIRGVPKLRDVEIMTQILKSLGGKIEVSGDSAMEIKFEEIKTNVTLGGDGREVGLPMDGGGRPANGVRAGILSKYDKSLGLK